MAFTSGFQPREALGPVQTEPPASQRRHQLHAGASTSRQPCPGQPHTQQVGDGVGPETLSAGEAQGPSGAGRSLAGEWLGPEKEGPAHQGVWFFVGVASLEGGNQSLGEVWGGPVRSLQVLNVPEGSKAFNGVEILRAYAPHSPGTRRTSCFKKLDHGEIQS